MLVRPSWPVGYNFRYKPGKPVVSGVLIQFIEVNLQLASAKPAYIPEKLLLSSS